MKNWAQKNKTRILITTADISSVICSLVNGGIDVTDVSLSEPLQVFVSVNTGDLEASEKIIEKIGASYEIIQSSGIKTYMRKLKNRSVLLVGVFLLLVATFILPNRIWFVQVKGNAEVPEKLILEEAFRCGISPGTKRKGIRSEKVKNELMDAIDQLQWVGVNTKGCVATISVKERNQSSQIEREPISSAIVASRDGIVSKIITQKGNAVCQPGQAVIRGQLLISGISDCGSHFRMDRAEGEVYASTMHELHGIIPSQYKYRGQARKENKKYYLIIGKKKINFLNGSSIFDSSCGKMYLEEYWTLPGGYQLPIGFGIETQILYENDLVSANAEEWDVCLRSYASSYILEQMISGQIQQEVVTVNERSDGFYLTGRYFCTEMIGRERFLEIG